MNERYGKYTAPGGKTRKSAASAKPKRAAGANAPSSPKKAEPSASKKRVSPIIHPTTPEYRRWRIVWWSLLGGAILFSTLAWWLWQDEARRSLGNWVLGAGYAMIFAAIGVDWLKLRTLRQAWIAAGGEAGAAKAAKAEEKAAAKAAGESTDAAQEPDQS